MVGGFELIPIIGELNLSRQRLIIEANSGITANASRELSGRAEIRIG